MFKTFLILIPVLFLFACQPKPDLVVLETDYGDITIKVDYDHAPKHAENFVKLVQQGFYDGLTFHRLIAGTIIQGGDPNTKDDDPANDGFGGPGYSIDEELGLKNVRGAVGAPRINGSANPQRKSNGSQFYICLKDIPLWDGKYTVFGKVVNNLKVAEKISWEPTDLYNFPKNPIYIKRAYLKQTL